MDLDDTFFEYDAEDTATEAANLKTGQKIYWFTEQVISDKAVKSFLSYNGYASNILYPATTRKYASGDNFVLYNSPNYLQTKETIYADKDMYIHLPLVFKVFGGDNTSTQTLITHCKINLSALDVNGPNAAASRLYLKSNSVNALVKGDSYYTSSSTIVGGPLDLNMDGQFDYYQGADGSYYEAYYGTSTGSPTYGTPYSDTVDGTSFNYDCFSNPDHTQGVYPISNASSVAASAQYTTLNDYVYQSDSEKSESSMKPIVVTDDYGMGFLDVYEYLEGWDHSTTNLAIGESLGTTLKFSYAGKADS